jgi:hypothetical protein
VSLTPAQIAYIRTSGKTDYWLARLYRVCVTTVRRARIGESHRDHPSPPVRSPREGAGRRASPEAKPARVRRSYFCD